MRYPVLWLLAACLPACGISVDYNDTEYRCNQSGRCPDGFDCVEGMCIRGSNGADAGFDRPDAPDDDQLTMLREVSDRNIPIPDGSAEGIADAVAFEVDCEIADITVDIDIAHDWRGDLVVSLTSPADTEVDLRDYDDDEEGDDDLVGTYPTTLTPSESLEAFFGEDSAGLSILRVADLGTDDVGMLRGWAVNLWCYR